MLWAQPEPVPVSAGDRPIRITGRPSRIASAACLTLLLGGCATYHAKPLPSGPDLARAPALEVPAGKLRIPDLKPHPFDASRGLDATDVVILAVVDNPELKARRLQAGVARAQLLQAGLLPDPQLSAGFIHPSSGPPPLTNGHSLGLTQALESLVTRGAAKAGARAHAQQVNLEILWQEWQVAEQARQLFIRARSEKRLAKILKTQRDLSARAYQRDERALKQGNLTLSAVSADLVNLTDADTRLRKLQRRRNRTWHRLDAVLGLKPGVEPRLRGSFDVRPFSQARFRNAIRALPQRRPDLLALQAGYRSQEQAVRKAILAQFPALSVGLTGGQDTSAVHSLGVSVSLSLPFFNRNQGQIAIQRATRAAMRQAYQARLDQAVNQAHEVYRATRIMHRQLAQLRARLPVLKKTTEAARRSFEHGNLSAGTYISLRSSLLAKRAEAVRLEASLQSSQAALETLLGMTLDGAHPQPGEAHP